MDFEKVSEAIKKSSNQVKNLFFSNHLGEVVQDIAWENKLNEDLALKLGDEVGYVILDLKPKSSFYQSLLEIGIEKNVAKLVENEVNSKIFSELSKINTKEISDEETVSKEHLRKEKLNTLGQSFEDIILHQAQAMQPARLANETERMMNQELGINQKNQAPENLPVVERDTSNEIRGTINKKEDLAQINNRAEKPEISVPNYTNRDPYREPIE